MNSSVIQLKKVEAVGDTQYRAGLEIADSSLILHPLRWRRVAWDIFIGGVLLYVGLVTPYEVI